MNKLVCRVMYGVTPCSVPPLPDTGPVLLVSDHSTLGDPMVLFATAGRRIRFLMAKEIYDRPSLKWIFRTLDFIPVRRGAPDIRAVRSMLKALGCGDAVAVFPEGGIDNFRNEAGHVGVAYLAVKTGTPVVPVSVRWECHRPESMWGTLSVPGKATVRYGTPLQFPQEDNPTRQQLEAVTGEIMCRIRELQGDDSG